MNQWCNFIDERVVCSICNFFIIGVDVVII